MEMIIAENGYFYNGKSGIFRVLDCVMKEKESS